MYEELLENEIILEIERENPYERTIGELGKVIEKLDETVAEYDKQIEASEDVSKRKQMRSMRMKDDI